MKKTFNISTVDPLLFIGPQDQNIKLIEKSFKSKIVTRGNEIIIDGLKREVDVISSLINDMIITINSKDRNLTNETNYNFSINFNTNNPDVININTNFKNIVA